MVDTIIEGQNRTYREYASYYTDSQSILNYMVSKLSLSSNDNVLEPCAGNGAFIEKIQEQEDVENIHITAFDLNPRAIDVLKEKFGNNSSISIRKDDTLVSTYLDKVYMDNGHFDKVIGNPPYGAWQDRSKRELLKKKYDDYAKETYTLFINRCLQVLKPGGRLVFIVPDTFLALNMHKKLRIRLLESCQIDEVTIIPSKFFPGVNFGYSNLSIVTIDKKKPTSEHKIRINFVKKDKEILNEMSHGNYNNVEKKDEVCQFSILNAPNSSFMLNTTPQMRNQLMNAKVRIGDIADCVTGFYSGDNKIYVKKIEDISIESVCEDMTTSGLQNGLKHDHKYIPILKGKDFIIKNNDFVVRWDANTVKFYKENKKARFQNSKYYFHNGLGLPMVKSRKVQSFLLENRLFDQSVVGIFPHDEKFLYYLLAYFNSDIFNRFIHALNHTSNNSANYIKQVPFIFVDKDLKKVDSIIKDYVNKNVGRDKTEKLINDYFESLFSDYEESYSAC